MRKSMTLFLKALPLLLVLLAFTGLRAQVTENFQYTISGQAQVSSKIFEFDLNLLDLDNATQIQVATVQAGVLMSNTVYNGGTVTAAIVAGSSTMLAAQVPSSVTYTQTANVVKLAAKAPPGCGGGTLMSQDPNAPTRLCRIRLTNTADWTASSIPNLTFCFTTVPYPTKISEYDAACLNTAIVVNASTCFNTNPSFILNAPSCVPTVFAVTGGGSFCQGGAGVQVGL
jgi:hypothetical protein